MKKKYKIHEVAERIGVSPSLIRYYEEKGIIKVEKDPENGYRYFSDSDLFKIWIIAFHRAMNMSLGDINVLMHSYSLDETTDAISAHREKTQRVLEQARRTLEICDFYDRYIALARREGETPLVVPVKKIYLYSETDIFQRVKPSFPACTFGSIFQNGEETQYSAVYEEDMHLLSSEEQLQYEKELILTDMVSVVVNVDQDSFASDALAKGLAITEKSGYAVCEPYYVLYLLSFGDTDDLEYSYEILMTLQKDS